MAHHVKLSLCTMACVVVSMLACQCTVNTTGIRAEEQRQAAQAVAELTGLLENQVFLIDEDVRNLRDYVHTHVTSGDFGCLAAMINVPGPWHSTTWYREVCQDFAYAFCADRPIAARDAPQALRALYALATSHEGYRDTAVFAARAIRFEYPTEAKAVFLREYARGGVSTFLLGGLPQPCGETLRTMGVFVPDEIIYVGDVAEALKRMRIAVPADEFGEFDDQTLRQLELTGIKFNEELRDALDRGDMDALRWIYGRRDRQIAEIYADVQTRPPPQPTDQGNIFGGGKVDRD